MAKIAKKTAGIVARTEQLRAQISKGEKGPLTIERYRNMVDDLPKTLSRDVGQARAHLRTLLGKSS